MLHVRVHVHGIPSMWCNTDKHWLHVITNREVFWYVQRRASGRIALFFTPGCLDHWFCCPRRRMCGIVTPVHTVLCARIVRSLDATLVSQYNSETGSVGSYSHTCLSHSPFCRTMSVARMCGVAASVNTGLCTRIVWSLDGLSVQQ